MPDFINEVRVLRRTICYKQQEDLTGSITILVSMMRMGPGISGTAFIHADNPVKAQEIQETLRHRCIVERTIDTGRIRYIAGADAAYADDMIYAAVVVLTFPGLEVVEKTCTARKVPFPYIPGLLSFREGPALLDAFDRLATVPDLIFINGHGYAHPKRFGIASHVGLILDIPSVGIAQRLLTGTAAFPGAERGYVQPVLDRSEVIGMAVRTMEGQKPVFVSAGHRVDLEQAVEMALKTTMDHRISEPVWHADQVSRQCRDRQSGT
jgi:deoxyribonuclease V